MPQRTLIFVKFSLKNGIFFCAVNENLGNYAAFCPKFSNRQFGKTAAQSTKLSINKKHDLKFDLQTFKIQDIFVR